MAAPWHLVLDDLLPASAQTKTGVWFTPRSGHWAYREGTHSVSLNFDALPGATSGFVIGLKKTLLWYAKNRSSHHVKNLFERIKHFLMIFSGTDSAPLEVITSEMLINYRSSLTPSTHWYLSTLAGLLKKWHRLGYPGVTADAVTFLKQVRLKGNTKGMAVLTMDTQDGPFTDIELQAIQSAFCTAYAQGEVSLSDYMLGWLFMLLGQRPAQYALLKVCDISVARAKDGTEIYILKIPRVKRRQGALRTSVTNRLLTPQIGALLIQYTKVVEEQFIGKLKDTTQAPLFPASRAHRAPPQGFEFHSTAYR